MKNQYFYPRWLEKILVFFGLYFLIILVYKEFSASILFAILLFYPLYLFLLLKGVGFSDSEDGFKRKQKTANDLIYIERIQFTICFFFGIVSICRYAELVLFCREIINSRGTILLSNYIEIQKTDSPYKFLAVPFLVLIFLYFFIISFFCVLKISKKDLVTSIKKYYESD